MDARTPETQKQDTELKYPADRRVGVEMGRAAGDDISIPNTDFEKAMGNP
jgi:hypothetical protein